MAGRKHFTGWDGMALRQAVDFLCRDWTSGPLDLRRTLIIVPTRHAGRRLRERLAAMAATRHTAVLTGPVETPAFLFAPNTQQPIPLTSDMVAEAFWRKTLSNCHPGQFPSFSPISYADNPRARAAAAEHLAALRAELCEEGYTLSAFAKKTESEQDRWADIVRLETLYLEQLKAAGWRDDVSEKLRRSENPVLPDTIDRVVVLFVPDPPPLALVALEVLSSRLPVDICIHADENDAGRFDEWGRPLPERWAQQSIPLAPGQVEVCDDTTAMLIRVNQTISSLPDPVRTGLTVGMGNAQYGPRLSILLEQNDIPAFDPGGRPVSGLPLFVLIDRLLEFHRDPTFSAFMNLARHPDALRRLEEASGVPDRLLPMLDEFQNRRMPFMFPDAANGVSTYVPRHSGNEEAESIRNALSTAMEETTQWIMSLENKPLSTSLPDVLARIYRDHPANDLLRSAIVQLRDTLDKLVHIERICPDRSDAMDFFRRIVSGQRLSADKPAQAVELSGWLELAWEDNPVVLLTDLTDGTIPQTIVSDPFLPDRARRETGLRDNRQRLARDAHTLESILRSRRPENVRGFLPRRSPDGDPLKPSRLLLQGPPDELALRVKYFFSDAPSPLTIGARNPGWLIRPPLPDTEHPHPLSPTGLKAYLDCPLKFYLERILHMRDPFKEKTELDAREFGDLCHNVMNVFAKSDIRDSDREEDVKIFLHEQIEKAFTAQFGRELTLPLMVQRDVLLQRMTYAATVQTRLRREGWRIVLSEKTFELDIEGLKLKGRIDRVDQNEQDGRIRVIDYKTTSKAEWPHLTHLGKTGRASSIPVFAVSEDGSFYWKDLQLPLYVHAYRALCNDHAIPVEAAYFCLPNAVTDTDLKPWENLTETQLQDALTCARRIARRMKAGVFWPPRMNPTRDEPFRRAFFDDLPHCLHPDFVSAMEKRADAFDSSESAKGGIDRA